MGQQSASASSMRNSENQARFGQDRKGQAHKGEAQGRKAIKAPYAGRSLRQVEGKANRDWPQMGAPRDWEIRCAALGQDSWLGYRGPQDAWRMLRIFADAIDHDAARPLAFGGKKVIAEIREKGSETLEAFELTGSIRFEYQARKIAC